MNEITTISTDRFEQFCETLAKQARELIFERKDKLREAWLESMEEATASDEDLPQLKFALACSIDLAKNRAETKISFATRYTLIESEELTDPNQPPLPGLKVAKSRKGGEQ